MIIIQLIFISLLLIILPSATLSQLSYIEILVEGKKNLNSANYSKSEELLTNALTELKEIGDYILLWRAQAYIGMNKYENAKKDLELLKKNYPRSPILKDARKIELEIVKNNPTLDIEKLYESFINEYSEEISIKFDYALYLKEKGQKEKAKRFFKEIFLTASSLADKAENELSKEDITVNDLLKKGRALNNAYQFKKAEKYLRDALMINKNSNKNEILYTLGYSVFMQKRYTEAAEIFKSCGENYWRARALLRARDFETFEKESSNYMKIDDQRMADVFINYANIKRRAGAHGEASKILRTVVTKYADSKEEALWYMAWNHYNAREYDEARKVLQELYANYGKPKYFYWLDKINEMRGVFTTKEQNVSFRQGDLYSYLLYMKGKTNLILEPIQIRRDTISFNRRIDLFLKAGFKEEALREIKLTLKENRDSENIPLFSKLLQDLGDYPTSVRLISKFPNRFNYQELLYPQAYRDTVLKASARFNIDPYLLFAIMREESRFDRLALSPAGALGLMQLMTDTAKREGKKIGITFKRDSELFEQEKNILIGSYYLKNLIDEFGNVVFAIAAYNAGEKAVWGWLKNYSYNSIDEFIEDIPYGETRNYVQRVLTSYFEYLRGDKKLNQEYIFKITKIRGGKL